VANEGGRYNIAYWPQGFTDLIKRDICGNDYAMPRDYPWNERGTEMFSDSLSTSDTAISTKTRAQIPAAEGQPWDRTYPQLIFWVFVLNVISAALFIGFVNRPVYDDQYNIVDVHMYAAKGLSSATLLSHRNPPGPGSFLWMAGAVRLLGGEELRDARIAVLLSWMLLVLGILTGARFSSFPQLWYGALLTLLLFPHAAEATATVLTEGPALLFAVLGALAWTEFVSRPHVTAGTLMLGSVGGLSMGVAVTCRQYYLALLPAAALLALYQLRRNGMDTRERSRRFVSVILSIGIAVVPVVLLAGVWRGLSSPGMATGTSYQMMWKARLGLNFSRPIISAFYTAFYLVPFTFPAMLRLKSTQRWQAMLVASLGGIVAADFMTSLLQPGPLRSLVQAASRVPYWGIALFGLIAVVTIFNAIALGQLLWEQRAIVLSSPPIAFALLTIIFFIGEQFGVGGNIPLYDRYLLQLAPFLGIVAFSCLPRLSCARLLALAGLFVVSNVMLWRYAFGN
jgi:hypothetical protein